jgi:hypothetical protein
MSILDFGTYIGVLMSIPYFGISWARSFIYQNTVILVVLWAYWILVHNTTYMGVLMRIPYFGVSWARSFIYQNILILVVLMSILDFGTYIWACLWAYLIVVSHKHAQIYSKIRYKYWLCSWAYWIFVHIWARAYEDPLFWYLVSTLIWQTDQINNVSG